MNIDPATLDELLQASGRGDHRAFERLYGLAAPKLFAVCRHMLRAEALAEEALQEAFVQVWRDAAKFDPARAKAMTWMAVIARHRCLDLLRQRRAEGPLDDAGTRAEQVEHGAGPLELALHWSDQAEIGRCMEALSQQQRVSIAMAFYRGLTHQELAAYLATPIGTIKSWIRRGLERLKECLQP